MKKQLFILAIIFCLFMIPKNAFALEIVNNRPVSISYWTQPSTALTDTNLNTYSIFNSTYYGYEFNADNFTYSVSFNYNSDTRLNNVTHDVSFALYNSLLSTSLQSPFQVYISDSNSNISSCQVQSNSSNHFGYDNTTPYISSTSVVTCKDVFVNGPFKVVIGSDFKSRGIFAISNLTSKISDYQQQQLQEQKKTNEELKKHTEAINKQTDTIKDSNTDEASSSANSFFSDFKSDDNGLSDIVTLPLQTIKKITSSTCSSLKLPLPYVEKNLELPCIRSIFEQYFNPILLIYQSVTFGFIAYYVIVRIFNLVKDFKNPEHDEIEVLDL